MKKAPLLTLSFLLAVLHGSSSEEEYQKVGVAHHNKLRKQHGVGDLEGNEELHEIAVKCAEYYLRMFKVDHSCPHKNKVKNFPGLGENIYAIDGWNDPYPFIGKVAINNWYEEIKDWKWKEPKAGVLYDVGHFTQLVWKSSKKVGFGMAQRNAKNRGKGVCVVALYYPGGNLLNMFMSNVLPKNGTKA